MPIHQSITVQLGVIAYLVRGRIEQTFHPDLSRELGDRDTVTPAVVLHTESSRISIELLERSFARFGDEDDVFSDEFLKNNVLVIQCLHHGTPSRTLPEDVKRYLDERSTKLVFVDRSGGKNVLPQGPYFASQKGLHQAWRLYEDDLAAFVSSVIPSDDPYLFDPLKAAGYTGLHRAVAVPSRLYYSKTAEKPLNGMRVAIKDNVHLNGIVTTIGSRSYTACYGVQNVTSSFVKHLISQGAVIVGKTKLSAYAGSEIPPEKCIDYFPPWNARADGYQGPSGSSSGAGSSIGGYSWLDLSLATDTTGSMRMPASAHGVWGLRVTWNVLPLDGVVPSAPSYDTFGILGRSADKIREALLSYGLSEPAAYQLPKKILYPTDWFPYPNAEQQQMTEEFVGILEDLLGVSHTKISLREEWTRSAPEDLRATPIAEFLHNTVEWVNLYDGYHSFDSFREQHRKLFGQEPYVSPYHSRRWALGMKITKEQRAQADKETKVYKDWIDANILTKDESGASEAIMILPLGRPGPNYRDIVPPQNTGAGWYGGYDEDFFSSMLGLPQLVIPIGQNPYQSRISGKTEYFPIVGSIAGPQGSDLMLLQVALKALEKAGWPTKVLPGSRAFALGNNNRHACPSEGKECGA